MNDKPTPVFPWSAKTNRRQSKHHIFAPLRLRVNKIIHHHLRLQYEEFVHAETRSRGAAEKFDTMGESGWLLFSLTAEGIGTASSLPERNTSASPREPILRLRGRLAAMCSRTGAQAHRRTGAEIRRSSRGRAYGSERERVFRTLGGVCLGVAKNCHFFDGSEDIAYFAKEARPLLPVGKSDLAYQLGCRFS